MVNEKSVSLCYRQMGDLQSFSGVKAKEIEVFEYSFQKMYEWYGLEDGVGYSVLISQTQKNVLEWAINHEVEKLSHIKYNGGYLVRFFQ